MFNSGAGHLRPEIADAWRRAALSGLTLGQDVSESPMDEVNHGSRLMIAAVSVLDRLGEHLRGTRFSALLADRDARIVDRRFDSTRLADTLDGVLAVPGHCYTEDVAGTNALATAFEIRRGISVVGEEHFLERLKGFCCYGQPILHPVSRRLEGVLDVTGYAEDATPLLGPFVAQAAQDIEMRLLDGSDRSDQHKLAVSLTVSSS